jgi:polysaccharide deacetylase 2 family uncharacterized protein YibQ
MKFAIRCFALLLSALPALPVGAESPLAMVAIVIDDLGYNPQLANQALDLPGPVSFGILPELPQSRYLAEKAHRLHRDILLHIPMEPVGDQLLGPGGLTTSMKETEIGAVLQAGLASVPYTIGVSNHMGSRFSADESAMRLFMAQLQNHDKLFFLDSLTTPRSQGQRLATEAGIPVLARDVFLDNDRSEAAIERQFTELLDIALKRGHAIAIAHPYPETLEFLKQHLQALKDGPVRLVPVSLLLTLKTGEK